MEFPLQVFILVSLCYVSVRSVFIRAFILSSEGALDLNLKGG